MPQREHKRLLGRVGSVRPVRGEMRGATKVETLLLRFCPHARMRMEGSSVCVKAGMGLAPGVRHKVRGFWSSGEVGLAGRGLGGVVGRTLVDGAGS